MNDGFLEDVKCLFLESRYGHMERWEYGHPRFEGDLAAGASHWASLIKSPGDYYLTQADADNINWAIRQKSFQDKIKGTRTLIELGPGCEISLMKKTLPFYECAKTVKNYIAIDGTKKIASNAAEFFHKHTGTTVSAIEKDFFNGRICEGNYSKASVVFWGSSLGNFEGEAGQDPLPGLKKFLENLVNSLSPNDAAILSFDTESDKRAVINAYMEPALKRQILSVIHRIDRDGIVTGNFDPSLWRHEPVWIEENLQCAHYVYPVSDQDFFINEQEFRIPAGKRFISNNSYKYRPEQMLTTAEQAGFATAEIFQSGPMAILAAIK